ncbi:MAG: hypothetical protein V4667_10075 [Bacteroidota bacterium]
MSNSYLNDIKNFPEETKKEFLLILKKNLNEFFTKIEIAIQNQDAEAISQLVHKVMPTLIMLELKTSQDFFTNLKSNKNNLNNISQLLLDLTNEKQKVTANGWL